MQVSPKTAQALKKHVGSLDPNRVLSHFALDEHGESSAAPGHETEMRKKLASQGQTTLPNDIFNQYQDQVRSGRSPDAKMFPAISRIMQKQYP
jgi:hypothetical protein